jgi:hypothetical protein
MGQLGSVNHWEETWILSIIYRCSNNLVVSVMKVKVIIDKYGEILNSVLNYSLTDKDVLQ